MWIIDIVVLLIIAIAIAVGYTKGLTGSLFGIIAFVLSLTISFMLYLPVSKFIKQNTKIDDRIQISISSIMNSNSKEINMENEDKNNLPKAVTKIFEEKVQEAKNGVQTTSVVYLTNACVNLLSGMIVFIISKIILELLKRFTKIFANLPVIKQFDKLGGFIYGAVKGIFIVYLALAFISIVMPQSEFVRYILTTKITAGMYNNNILLLFLIK